MVEPVLVLQLVVIITITRSNLDQEVDKEVPIPTTSTGIGTTRHSIGVIVEQLVGTFRETPGYHKPQEPELNFGITLEATMQAMVIIIHLPIISIGAEPTVPELVAVPDVPKITHLGKP